jgi:hypothetical protein
VPRRLIGYDRYSSKAASAQMARVYGLVRLYVNFFQPVSKLIGKTRDGAKVRKKYDEATTPYQRLLASGVLDGKKDGRDGEEHTAKRDELAALYLRLNPAKLRRQIDEALEDLWKLSDREIAEQKAARQSECARATKPRDAKAQREPAQPGKLAVASG